MVDYMFTFVVPVQLPFFDYDNLLDLLGKDLANENNIEFAYGHFEDYKYRILMWNCTKKKVEEVCTTLQGCHIRQLDVFTAKCILEVLTDSEIII